MDLNQILGGGSRVGNQEGLANLRAALGVGGRTPDHAPVGELSGSLGADSPTGLGPAIDRSGDGDLADALRRQAAVASGPDGLNIPRADELQASGGAPLAAADDAVPARRGWLERLQNAGRTVSDGVVQARDAAGPLKLPGRGPVTDELAAVGGASDQVDSLRIEAEPARQEAGPRRSWLMGDRSGSVPISIPRHDRRTPPSDGLVSPAAAHVDNVEAPTVDRAAIGAAFTDFRRGLADAGAALRGRTPAGIAQDVVAATTDALHMPGSGSGLTSPVDNASGVAKRAESTISQLRDAARAMRNVT